MIDDEVSDSSCYGGAELPLQCKERQLRIPLQGGQGGH